MIVLLGCVSFVLGFIMWIIFCLLEFILKICILKFMVFFCNVVICLFVILFLILNILIVGILWLSVVNVKFGCFNFLFWSLSFLNVWGEVILCIRCKLMYNSCGLFNFLYNICLFYILLNNVWFIYIFFLVI